jgi:DNA-binding MarR family transcriptional regulator
MSTDLLDTLRALRRSMSRAAASAFAGTGVGPKQVLVLRELRRVGGASQVDLSRATLTDPATIMRAIDGLERRGWVVRSSAEGDRRRNVVSLTDEGRRALAGLDVPYEALRSHANRALSRAERDRFCELAGKVAAVLEAAGADAAAAEAPPVVRERAAGAPSNVRERAAGRRTERR